MIEPKNYKVKENVDIKDILSCGFQSKSDRFRLRRELYDHYIYANIAIEKEDYTLNVSVYTNDDGLCYGPFYDPEWRHNNLVYEEVVKKYNLLMDRLVKKNILEYDLGVKNMNNTEKILIKYHTDVTEIKMQPNGDWIDLRAAETVHLKKDEFKLISLGVSMQLPEGYEAHIVPRSSTYKSFGIIQTNHQAVIDESYCGDNDIWRYPAYALRETTINKNDRICQFRIVKKQPQIEFEKVDFLDGKDRGGIGSTGKN